MPRRDVPSTPLKSQGFHQRLRKLRTKADLSQRRLGALAGLSDATVQAIEQGGRMPGIDTVERLATVLGVSDSWLAYGEGALMRDDLHYWIAPDFDPIKATLDLNTLLANKSGHIEQSYIYIDHLGAASWCALTKLTNHAAMVESLPLNKVARALLNRSDAFLDIIGLGCGTARHEIRLVSHLLQEGQGDLRLFILDISQALLSIAYQQARELLGGQPSVVVQAMLGDFHKLPAYEHVFKAHTPRQRAFCMFGYTLGNLANEIKFLRSSLSLANPGDFLLLDVTLCRAPAQDPDAIIKADPPLSKRRPADYQKLLEDFMTTPIRRYVGQAAQITVTPHLDTRSCSIPGSYAIEFQATVDDPNYAGKSFAVAYVKRYEPKALIATLDAEGWELIDDWRYGGEFQPAMLALFRRKGH